MLVLFDCVMYYVVYIMHGKRSFVSLLSLLVYLSFSGLLIQFVHTSLFSGVLFKYISQVMLLSIFNLKMYLQNYIIILGGVLYFV